MKFEKLTFVATVEVCCVWKV